MVSTSIFLNWLILQLDTWSSSMVQDSLPKLTWPLCHRSEKIECQVVRIGIFDIPIQMYTNAETKRKTISRLQWSSPSSVRHSPLDKDSSFSSWLASFFKRSMGRFEANYIFSVAVSMKIAVFERVVLIYGPVLVIPNNWCLSVAPMLHYRYVTVHSFHSFEIPKLQLCRGSKVKIRYKLGLAPSIKLASCRNDFHGAKVDCSNATLSDLLLPPLFLYIQGALNFSVMQIYHLCDFAPRLFQ